MDIGISSACFYPDIYLENSVGLMKELGFNMGELFLNTPSEFNDDFIDILIEEKEKNKFTINSVHGFSTFYEPFLFDNYDRRSKDMMKYFKQICKAGKRLGAKSYTFHGMRKVDLRYFNMNKVVEVYNQLIYTASEIGIKLAQENVSWCMSSNLSFLSSLQEKCRYPLYFTLDIKQAYKAGIDIDEYIKIMSKNIVNLHLNDNDKENVCLLPGQGDVNFKYIFSKLESLGYKGGGIIEVYRDNYTKCNELSKSRELLEEIK